MNRILSIAPRPVLISIIVAVVTLVGFAVAFEVLGGGRDAALSDNVRLTSELAATNTSIKQSAADQQYVKENTERYEALLKSDRLIPHTRRAAVLALQSAAEVHGLSDLGYTFSASGALSAESVATQPKSGAYAVAVEGISLRIQAPLDGPVYKFLTDLPTAFPGSVVLQNFSVSRAPDLNETALAKIGELVKSEATFVWRTAQAAQQPGAEK